METKQHKEPYPTAHDDSSGANKDHPSVATMNTIGMLPFTSAIMEKPLPHRWTMPIFYKYENSIDPD